MASKNPAAEIPLYKKDFIIFLLESGALKVNSDYSLKSKRLSPHFLNIGDSNDGESTGRLGEAYARDIQDRGIEFDSIYGIPEKGIALAVATAIGINRTSHDVKYWFFTRKAPKEYGEATNLPKTEMRKAMIVGHTPLPGERILVEDDVFTTGTAKFDALADLEKLLDNYKVAGLEIACDRQEVGIDGKSAISDFTEKTGVPVGAIINAVEIYYTLMDISETKRKEVQERVLKLKEIVEAGKKTGAQVRTENVNAEFARYKVIEESLLPQNIERMRTYLRVYGTKEARTELGPFPEQTIIGRDRSVIPACDVSSIEDFEKLVIETADVDGIGGYKVGFELALGYGLSTVVNVARKHTDKPIIYDHQKAGTDIPDTGKNFARVCKAAGVDGVIMFPLAGPETERAWIYHALDQGLNVIVGGWMTHPAFTSSEGGFIMDKSAIDMYLIAAEAGINNFVVPGTKPEAIRNIRQMVEAVGVKPVFYAPGFVAQEGKIENAAKEAGERWHAIVGRGIYLAEDKRKAAMQHASQL